MKDKDLPDDIEKKSLIELKDLADNLIKQLENKQDLENSETDYRNLITINNLIQKKFQKASRDISDKTKFKINQILKNEK